jgi:nucleotide-binding universal stress UspA family protein
MSRILLPVSEYTDSRAAVQWTIAARRSDPCTTVHVLVVHPPISAYVAGFVRHCWIDDMRAERAEAVLQPVRREFQGANVPYQEHVRVGHPADVIAREARRLACDQVVIATDRRSGLVRALAGSVSSEVLELCPVPVVLIPAEEASALQRYGVPAAVGGGLGLLVAAASG